MQFTKEQLLAYIENNINTLHINDLIKISNRSYATIYNWIKGTDYKVVNKIFVKKELTTDPNDKRLAAIEEKINAIYNKVIINIPITEQLNNALKANPDQYINLDEFLKDKDDEIKLELFHYITSNNSFKIVYAGKFPTKVKR